MAESYTGVPFDSAMGRMLSLRHPADPSRTQAEVFRITDSNGCYVVRVSLFRELQQWMAAAAGPKD